MGLNARMNLAAGMRTFCELIEGNVFFLRMTKRYTLSLFQA